MKQLLGFFDGCQLKLFFLRSLHLRVVRGLCATWGDHFYTSKQLFIEDRDGYSSWLVGSWSVLAAAASGQCPFCRRFMENIQFETWGLGLCNTMNIAPV